MSSIFSRAHSARTHCHLKVIYSFRGCITCIPPAKTPGPRQEFNFKRHFEGQGNPIERQEMLVPGLAVVKRSRRVLEQETLFLEELILERGKMKLTLEKSPGEKLHKTVIIWPRVFRCHLIRLK